MGEPRLFMIRMMTTFLWCLPWKERPVQPRASRPPVLLQTFTHSLPTSQSGLVDFPWRISIKRRLCRAARDPTPQVQCGSVSTSHNTILTWTIYRLTRQLPLNFDTDGDGASLEEGTFVPYNAQATIHSKEAFFGLILPISVHGRVSDIWRSYFTQRLMWLAGASLAFMPPLVKQERNIHDYLADL